MTTGMNSPNPPVLAEQDCSLSHRAKAWTGGHEHRLRRVSTSDSNDPSRIKISTPVLGRTTSNIGQDFCAKHKLLRG
jgi:hypothetical protein